MVNGVKIKSDVLEFLNKVMWFFCEYLSFVFMYAKANALYIWIDSTWRAFYPGFQLNVSSDGVKRLE